MGTRAAVTYVIVAVVLVLVIALFLSFMVVNATNKRGAAAREPAPPGIGPDEATPLGDTPEHTDERTGPATVVGRHETDDPDDAAHRARPGEAEGETRIRFDPEQPAPDRLGHRDR
jgi:hypothetical protein